MAEIKILMYSLDDVPMLVDTLYVKGYDNHKEIEKTMIELGMPPSGWNSGYAYSAEINSSVDHKDAMTLEQFKEHILSGRTKPKEKAKRS